jgi:VanZ family protein
MVILSFSSLSSESIEKVNRIIPLPNDKVLHASVYAGFGYLIRSSGFNPWQTFMTGSLLGALDEQTQKYSKGRDVSLNDWIADMIGLLIGLSLIKKK